jgi:hypothetical protein
MERLIIDISSMSVSGSWKRIRTRSRFLKKLGQLLTAL